MRLGIWLAAVLAIWLGSPLASQAFDAPRSASLERRLTRVEAELGAQAEARDRQADAFDAATSRIEIVNGALVGTIALATLLGAMLALRWVRELAERRIAAQVETVVRQTGREVFEADSAELREAYDEKFAELYRRFKRLVEDE